MGTILPNKISFYAAFISLCFATFNLTGQDLIDSLSWSTDGNVNVVKFDGNNAYIGGYFTNIGKKVGTAPFFDADNNLPDYEMPIIGDLYGSMNWHQAYAFESDGDGGWFVGGTYDYVDGNTMHSLVHILADKSVDPFFHVGFSSSSEVYVLKRENNYLYIGGKFVVEVDGVEYFDLIRYDLKQQKIDTQWQPLSESSGQVTRLEIGDKAVYIGGSMGIMGKYRQNALAAVDKITGERLDFPATGSVSAMKLVDDVLWVAHYGDDGYGNISNGLSVITKSDTKPEPSIDRSEIYASIPDGKGGFFVGGKLRGEIGIHHINAQLEKDKTFVQSQIRGDHYQTELLLDGNNLYVSDNSTINLDNGQTLKYLFKIDATTGEIDEDFKVSIDYELRTMCIVGEELYIGGNISTVAGEARTGIAALNKNTGALLPWNPEIYPDNYNAGYTGPDLVVSDIQVYDDYLYVAGVFQTLPDETERGKGNFSIARYHLSTGIQDAGFMIHDNYYDHPLIDKMAFKGNTMYIMGDDLMYSDGTKDGKFAVVDLNNPGIEKFNSDIDFSPVTSWSSTNSEMEIDGNRLYITDLNAINNRTTQEQKYIVSLNLDSKELDNWAPMPDYRAHTLQLSGDNVLVGGQFLYFQWNGGNHVTGIDIHTLEYITVFNSDEIKDIEVTDNAIFFAGYLAKVDTLTVNGIIKVNRQTLEVMPFEHKITNGGGKTFFGDIAIDGNKLYAVPIYYYEFDMVGDVPRKNICCINTETAELIPWNPAPFNGKPLVVYAKDNKVMLSGKIGLCENHEINSLAKINLKTKALMDWSPMLTGYYPSVNDMFIDGNNVFVGGSGIGKVNGMDAGDVCAIDKNGGGLVESFACHDYNGDVHWIAKQGNDIFVKGTFDKVNDVDRVFLCKVNAETGALSNWNAGLVWTWTNLYDIETTDDGLYVAGSNFNFGDDRNGKVIKFNLETAEAEKFYSFDQNIVRLTKNAENRLFGGSNTYTNGLVEILDDTIVSRKLNRQTYYGASSISTIGNLVFTAGNNYKQFESWKKNSIVQIYDPLIDSTIFEIPMNFNFKADKNLWAIDTDGEMLAVGGQFAKAGENIRVGDVAFYTLPNLNFPAEIISISPNKAASDGLLGVSIKGRGFEKGADVKLTMGNSTLVPDSMKRKDNILTAYFNLNQVEVGKYNVVVDLPGGSTLLKEAAVDIQEPEKADVWAEIIGPSEVMYRRPTTYYLNFGNDGNQHAYGTLIFLGVNGDQNIEWSRQLDFDDDWADWQNESDFIDAEGFFGQAFEGKVYPLFIPFIPGGTSHSISFTMTSESQSAIRLALIPNIMDEYAETLKSAGISDKLWSYGKCMYGVAGLAADLTPGVSCVKAVLENIIITGVDKYMSGDEFMIEDGVGAVSNTVLGCVPGSAQMSTAIKVVKKLVEGGMVVKDCGEFLEDIFYAPFNIYVYFSKDPNAKYGPLGNASSKYVQSNKHYTYMITYENVDSALIAATKVTIIDTLNSAVFDLSSFQPLALGFSDTTVTYPEEGAIGQTIDVDLRPDKNMIVRIEHDLNMETGVLTWVFSTLNPETMLLTEDVFGGFLPPNEEAPEGEGHVLFTINPKAAIANGATIQNSATIIFDWNDPIHTNNWVNLIDNTAPVSAVNALATEFGNNEFEVSWAGSDETSGIFAYDIFVSENDNNYYKWLSATGEVSAIFSGEDAATYKFYSVATDSAGNREDAPVIYDASTSVNTEVIENSSNMDNILALKVYPNPASESLTISLNLPTSSDLFISVVNECGATVRSVVTQHYTIGLNQIVLDVSNLAPGPYFIKISDKQFAIQKMFVVNGQ